MQDMYFKPHSNDGTVDGTVIMKFNKLILEGAAKIGRNWLCTKNYAQWFKEIGFEDVVETIYAWPLGTWAKGKKQKTIGLWALADADEGASSIATALLTRVLGMPLEEVDALLQELRTANKNKAIHSYYPV